MKNCKYTIENCSITDEECSGENCDSCEVVNEHRSEALLTKEVAKEKNTEVLALEIQPDHLHLFVSTHPNIPVHILIKAFKGRSSNLLRKEFPELLKLPSLWTHSYFVSTAGNVSSETIQKYIGAQSTK